MYLYNSLNKIINIIFKSDLGIIRMARFISITTIDDKFL